MKKNSGNFKRTSLSQVGLTNGCPAFTLTELVVVIGVIVLLAATLLPALAQSKVKSQAIVCLTNMRQLQRGALLYASDNNDDCPKNNPLYTAGDTSASGGGRPNWVDGCMASTRPLISEVPAGCATNPFYLGVNGTTGYGVTLIGSIGPYVKTAGAYHCPVDRSTEAGVPRVRSVSANMMIGCPPGGVMYGTSTSYKQFEKYSQFGAALAPSQCFEFLDEDPLSINDGWYEYMLDGSSINDYPAVAHDLATSFSFADGHAALHIWQDSLLLPESNPNSASKGADTMWLAQHGSYRIR